MGEVTGPVRIEPRIQLLTRYLTDTRLYLCVRHYIATLYVSCLVHVSYEDTKDRPEHFKKIGGSKILHGWNTEIVVNVYKLMKREAELAIQNEQKKVQ